MRSRHVIDVTTVTGPAPPAGNDPAHPLSTYRPNRRDDLAKPAEGTAPRSPRAPTNPTAGPSNTRLGLGPVKAGPAARASNTLRDSRKQPHSEPRTTTLGSSKSGGRS